MTENDAPWRQLSEQVDSLAGKLKAHLAQANADSDIKEALHDMKSAVNDALHSAGGALKDDEVRQNVREIGQLFADAFTTTVTRAASDLRDKVSNVTGAKASDATEPAGSEPSGPAGATGPSGTADREPPADIPWTGP